MRRGRPAFEDVRDAVRADMAGFVAAEWEWQDALSLAIGRHLEDFRAARLAEVEEFTAALSAGARAGLEEVGR